MNARDLIDYASNDDAGNFRSAMYAAIHDRVAAHIEAKKQEVAQSLVTQSEGTKPKMKKEDEAHHMKKEEEKPKHGVAEEEEPKRSPFPGSAEYKAKFPKKGESEFDKKKTEKGTEYHRKMNSEETELQTEEAGQFRLVSKHGTGKHTAKVYKDKDWGEYRVRHYQDGKHMGEDSDSHHDDLHDAQHSAEANIKHMDKKSK